MIIFFELSALQSLYCEDSTWSSESSIPCQGDAPNVGVKLNFYTYDILSMLSPLEVYLQADCFSVPRFGIVTDFGGDMPAQTSM